MSTLSRISTVIHSSQAKTAAAIAGQIALGIVVAGVVGTVAYVVTEPLIALSQQDMMTAAVHAALANTGGIKYDPAADTAAARAILEGLVGFVVVYIVPFIVGINISVKGIRNALAKAAPALVAHDPASAI